jgi:16S rRNA (cytidine1402-2'-O)-methyltransferase
MLQSIGVSTAMTSLHEHNEAGKAAALIDRLIAGESIALVSDAGTPLISDPGFNLIAVARARGVKVVPIPGACAAIAALCVAGLSTDRFAFEGFLAAKASARRSQLEALTREERTLLFYEAPHRIRETLDDMAAVFGAARVASVSRELTKRFETTYYGTLAELAALAAADADMARGEIVIVVAGQSQEARSSIAVDAEQTLRVLLAEVSPAQAAKIGAKLTGAKRADLYELALRIQDKGGATKKNE